MVLIDLGLTDSLVPFFLSIAISYPSIPTMGFCTARLWMWFDSFIISTLPELLWKFGSSQSLFDAPMTPFDCDGVSVRLPSFQTSLHICIRLFKHNLCSFQAN